MASHDAKRKAGAGMHADLDSPRGAKRQRLSVRLISKLNAGGTTQLCLVLVVEWRRQDAGRNASSLDTQLWLWLWRGWQLSTRN
jgi:hypothetical protein